MTAPDVATIPHLVLAAARSHGDRPAVIAEDGEVWSYRRLADDMARVARALLAQGLQVGDGVAVWAPNSPHWILAVLGAQMAGGLLVPVNTRFKGAEAAYVLDNADVPVLFAAGGFLGTDYLSLLDGHDLPRLRHRVRLPDGWDGFLAAGEAVPEEAAWARLATLSADTFSDMLYTSGTTGRPKGVLTTHGQNLRQYAAYGRCLGLVPGDRYLTVNPYFHSFGYKAGWLAALIAGATIYPHAVFDAMTVLRRIERDRITVMPGPPTVFQSLLAAGYRDHDISTLRAATTGSASVPVELVRRMRHDLGIEVVLTAYGLTESSGVVTVSLPGDDFETIARTVGKPIEGLEVKIVDREGAEVAPGEAGELLVRGYGVMKGYHKAPEATAEAVDSEGWLHTGDVAVADKAGYLRITGRTKDMFIVGGFNCYPVEIEHMLETHPDIAEAAVVGVPDERLGEVGKAFLVPRAGRAPSAEAVIAWCRGAMANYKVPRFVEFRDSLPRTAMGKVEKGRLAG